MIASAFFFYLFSAVMIASAVMVIGARNPVHSVLFLILAFVNAAGLFVLLGAEFLAMILVVVYVGAVAVLFLFVVMMLDVDFVELRQGFLDYLPVGALVGLVVLGELLLVLGSWGFAPEAAMEVASPIPPPAGACDSRASRPFDVHARELGGGPGDREETDECPGSAHGLCAQPVRLADDDGEQRRMFSRTSSSVPAYSPLR